MHVNIVTPVASFLLVGKHMPCAHCGTVLPEGGMFVLEVKEPSFDLKAKLCSIGCIVAVLGGNYVTAKDTPVKAGVADAPQTGEEQTQARQQEVDGTPSPTFRQEWNQRP